VVSAARNFQGEKLIEAVVRLPACPPVVLSLGGRGGGGLERMTKRASTVGKQANEEKCTDPFAPNAKE
jgi:hypothetical protein